MPNVYLWDFFAVYVWEPYVISVFCIKLLFFRVFFVTGEPMRSCSADHVIVFLQTIEMRNISSDVPKVDAREESLIPVLNKYLGNTRLQQTNKRENLKEFFVFITKKRFPSPNLSLCYLVLRWR